MELINLSKIKKLSQLKTKKNNLVITLYLNTNRRHDFQESYHTVFKDMLKEILSENISSSNDLKKDLKKIEKFINFEFSKKAKGLVIFSCVKENIWQVLELPVEVYNQYFLAHHPYIKPLLRILEDYDNFCVLLIDKEKSRIFSVYLGVIQEHLDVFDKVKGKHKQGGSSEARFQRHHEEEVKNHIKNVSQKLYSFFKRNKFDYLIIGYTTPEIWSYLENALPSQLKERIIGKFDVEIFASPQKILEKVNLLEKKIKKEKEKKLVDNFFNNLSYKKRAVSNLDDIINEIKEGRIDILIIDKSLAKKGYECLNCGYLTIWPSKECPICHFRMRTLKDIVEKMIKIALEKNVKINFVDNKKLRKIGGIGAVLRF